MNAFCSHSFLAAAAGASTPASFGGRGLTALDWIVIALYCLGMLAVGVYYSRTNVNTEEYLLGGRQMKPWTIGLSLFATLLSTISYLAYPGEMIENGPMILSGMLAYPLVMWVGGWVLIPFFTRLRVTSAYEILEFRLGLGARMLATFFFLALRLLWMAMIIYTTTSVVMLPILGLDAKWTIIIASIMGVVTIAYTTVGGLRAVVITDVTQTFILFAGAIAALVLISISLGGVGAWFPTRWDPNWAQPRFGFDSQARVTLANAMLSVFLWYVCTFGSDQMAIQRYLATRDAKSARRALGFTLGSEVAVTLLLAMLGFALFAYFRANPPSLPAGETTAAAADTLFPRYIVSGLPTGLSGLVIAGLLAAAMSSLSAGINSSSSVISVDLIKRFRRNRSVARRFPVDGSAGGNQAPVFGTQDSADEAKDLRQVKLISLGVGVVVVLLSFAFQYVGGNLFEVTAKCVNLFVVPLFILFFMAMFVPWARQFGAIVAALASLATAIAIAFFEVFGLKFLWIMPSALVTGIVAGVIVSLIPTSQTARQRMAELAIGLPGASDDGAAPAGAAGPAIKPV